ncbi:hypothetical protein GQ53DRAFT_775991 [Thozetella sp. PMI_491]|nr:hypothetical protein GQ53DRAFT_775991 [Thozetella sp. PMI_491]
MDFLASALLDRRDAVSDGLPNPTGEVLARLSIVFVCLSGFFVILRVVSRYYHSRATLGLDDVLIVAALANNGFGLHTSQVSSEHKIIAFKWFFAAQILYKIATCLTKLSICSLYLRLFPDRRLRIGVYTVMGITITYTLIAILLTVFSCNPIQKSWNKELQGSCLDSRSIWYGTSIMIILTDLMIIVLPINEIRRLQLPLVKKLLISCLFSLGVFVIACTMVRMISVSPQTTASDQIYYQAISNSWTFVETNVGIICACLPVLRVPLSKPIRKMLGLGSKGSANKSQPSHVYNSVLSTSASRGPAVSGAKGDSVEELINNEGIRMTTVFVAQVGDAEKQPIEKIDKANPATWRK